MSTCWAGSLLAWRHGAHVVLYELDLQRLTLPSSLGLVYQLDMRVCMC